MCYESLIIQEDQIKLTVRSHEDKKVIFVTNNATQSRRMYKGKFDKLGVEAHVVSINPTNSRVS